jgi:multidrug efflux pump subunit AcrB
MRKALEVLFHRRNLFIMLFVIILGYGIYSYIVIPKQEMPEIDTPYMAISMVAPGVSATYIEENVVKDIENVIVTYSDVTEVRSYVYDNYALSYVLFSYSTQDPDQLAVDIFTKINELSLDDSITELSYNSNFDDPHIIFSLYSETLSATELNNYAQRYKNQLIAVDEIQSVTIDSAFSEEVVVDLDTTQLQAYGLTVSDIYQIIYANSLNIPLGGINTIYGTISISGYREFNELSDLEELIIIPEIPGMTPTVYLQDIATISLEDTSEQYYEFNQQQAVFLSVYFKDDIDFTVLGDEVLEEKQAFLEDVDNSALSIDEMLFLPDYVNDQINNVFYSLLIAIGVVMIVVLVGIGFRNSVLVVLTIPVIIFGTIGTLYLSNYELHKLTIVGLIVAIGIMVDNSIVITEGIKRNIDRGMAKIEGAKQAIRDNFAPILSSTMTTIAAFIVLVLLPGFLGEIVSSLPLTVIIAISLSYIVSMILSPILAVLFLKPSKKSQKVDLNTIHHTRIRTMIRNTIKFPIAWLVLAIGALVFVVYFTFVNQPLDLYPNDERSVIYIDFENEILGDIESTRDLRDDITDVFIDNPHVVNVSSSIGGSLPHFHFSAELISSLPQFGRLYMNLDYDEQDLLDYVTELEDEYALFDNAKITVNIMELSPPIAPVRVTISGNDIDTVTDTSTLLFNEIIELESLKSHTIVQNIESMKYVITYDYTAIGSSFLTKAQVDAFIATELNGLDLDIFEYNNETINVHLRSNGTSIEELLSSSIYSEQLDQYIPLSNLISIRNETDYSIINRFNGVNVAYIDLYFANDASLTELENDVRTLISHHDTTGVVVSYGGENEMFEEISTDLIRASIIAILLIYIIMYIQFNNFVKPLIVFLTIPLSFIGSFLFLWIFDSPITATSLVGMVSLLGVTVNTGILLVEYISRHHVEHGDVEEACVEAVLLRFRPIMLTSLTTILGLIPLLITGGNFFQPMALTFMGGMVSSTLITIFLVPSMYKLVYKNKRA